MAFVYILRSGNEDLFKIGRTSGEVEARRKDLSTGNPHPLTVSDAIETEHIGACGSFLHGRLQSKRCAGDAREFFTVTAADLQAAIQEARAYLIEDLPMQKEADRLSKQGSDGRILQPGHDDWETHRRLLHVT